MTIDRQKVRVCACAVYSGNILLASGLFLPRCSCPSQLPNLFSRPTGRINSLPAISEPLLRYSAMRRENTRVFSCSRSTSKWNFLKVDGSSFHSDCWKRGISVFRQVLFRLANKIPEILENTEILGNSKYQSNDFIKLFFKVFVRYIIIFFILLLLSSLIWRIDHSIFTVRNGIKLEERIYDKCFYFTVDKLFGGIFTNLRNHQRCINGNFWEWQPHCFRTRKILP